MSATALKQISRSKSFDGFICKYSHWSEVCQCEMKFNIYLPCSKEKLPALYFLSGLTCTEDNFIHKSGALQYASEYKLILIAPDTSPRNCGIAGEDASWDFGTGAGFYVDATQKPWSNHYRMYSYITEELPRIINENFAVQGKVGVFGHSMGGHGALTVFLKNPTKYTSVSAFAPICHPIGCPWGIKAFTGYLGEDETTWKEYDACELLKKYEGDVEILVDQGMADNFLSQLMPDSLMAACKEKKNVKLVYRAHEEYDHSYYFISTFIKDHIKWHANKLN